MVARTKPLKIRRKKKKEARELTRLGSALRTLGGLGGSAVGGLIGMGGAGSDLGTSLGAALSRWLGSGDYEVASNTIVSRLKSSNSIPMMHNTGQSITVRHREYITDIRSTTAFTTALQIPINPGVSTGFPWLSTVAQNFMEYTVKGMVFHYIPTSGASVASTNTALGSVMIATNYRSSNTLYTNKQTLLNEYCASDARPTDSFCHPIECDPKENPYNVQYVRPGAVPTGEDIKTYDLGLTTIATQGMPGDGNIVGELWVSYEVELRKPTHIGVLQLDAEYETLTRTGVATSTAPWGTGNSTTPETGLISISGTTMTFSKGLVGNFLMVVAYPATGTTAWSDQSHNGTNITLLGQWQPKNVAVTTPTRFMLYAFLYNIPDPNVAATLTCSTNFVTGTVPDGTVILFQQVNPGLGF